MRIHQCHVKTGRRSCESSLTKGPSGSFAPGDSRARGRLFIWIWIKLCLEKSSLFFSIAPEIIFDDGQSRLKVFCLYERRPKFTDIFSHLGAVVSLLKLRKRDITLSDILRLGVGSDLG
jgi:hypothetical protein